MKAYRGVDGKIRLFRPMHNMARMNLTASRACLPAFDGYQLLECIRKYVVLRLILSYSKFYDEYHIIVTLIPPCNTSGWLLLTLTGFPTTPPPLSTSGRP